MDHPLTWWRALSQIWRQRTTRCYAHARRRQRREVTRLELAYRLDQAERMLKAQAEAHAREAARSGRQLEQLRKELSESKAQFDEAVVVIGASRLGVQLVAAQEALERAALAAVSGWGELDDAGGPGSSSAPG